MSWLSKLTRSVSHELGVGLDKLGFGEAAGQDIANAATTIFASSHTGLIGGGIIGGILYGDDEDESEIIPTVYGLPTNLPLAAATGELKSLAAKKRERSKTNITGGIAGGSGIAPTLGTA